MIVVPPQEQAGTSGKSGSQFTGAVFPYLTLPSTDNPFSRGGPWSFRCPPKL